ncbi:hypothetical protein ACH5RR_036818 [Cinchona calisaya]|uniref:Uncharacterized protein n=1 Tax=Cinchona calisaya TaxID=153742 RepID=A0ABD2Y8S9_9GENT
MDMEQDEVVDALDIQERGRQLVATEVICHVMKKILSREFCRVNYVDRPIGYRSRQSHIVRNELLMQLRTNGNLNKHHFHKVLRAVITLEDQFLRQPTGEQIPPKILNSDRFSPYFKDCEAAIDGTRVRVKVSSNEAARYRGLSEKGMENEVSTRMLQIDGEDGAWGFGGGKGLTGDGGVIEKGWHRELVIRREEGRRCEARSLGDKGFSSLSNGEGWRGVAKTYGDYGILGDGSVGMRLTDGVAKEDDREGVTGLARMEEQEEGEGVVELLNVGRERRVSWLGLGKRG